MQGGQAQFTFHRVIIIFGLLGDDAEVGAVYGKYCLVY